MRPLLAALLIAAVSLALAVPTASALGRGVVYSKIKETEDLNEAGEYGPPVGGLYTLRGKRPHRVTFDPADVEPNVARNGTIAFVRAGDVYLVRPDGTGLRQLTSGPEIDERPLFAPDGRSLVFTRRGVEKGPRDLYLVRLDGGPPIALATTAADESEVTFSPGGGEIAYVSGGDVYSMILSSGAVSRMNDTPEKEFAPRFFARGILFNRIPRGGPSAISRFSRDGSRIMPVVATSVGARIAGVTPNG